jgi:hypothetical protein
VCEREGERRREGRKEGRKVLMNENPVPCSGAIVRKYIRSILPGQSSCEMVILIFLAGRVLFAYRCIFWYDLVTAKKAYVIFRPITPWPSVSNFNLSTIIPPSNHELLCGSTSRGIKCSEQLKPQLFLFIRSPHDFSLPFVFSLVLFHIRVHLRVFLSVEIRIPI